MAVIWQHIWHYMKVKFHNMCWTKNGNNSSVWFLLSYFWNQGTYQLHRSIHPYSVLHTTGFPGDCCMCQCMGCRIPYTPYSRGMFLLFKRHTHRIYILKVWYEDCENIRAPTWRCFVFLFYHTVLSTASVLASRLHEHTDGSTLTGWNTGRSCCCCYCGTCPAYRLWWKALCRPGSDSWRIQMLTVLPDRLYPVRQRRQWM